MPPEVPGQVVGPAASRAAAGPVAAPPPAADRPGKEPGRLRLIGPSAVAVVLAAAVVARFLGPSALWLDEAQTVAIARLPVPGLLDALRQDGSPPLYYLLLHAWMAVFGSGAAVARSLSGLFGVATLPLVWWVARRLTGPRTAVAVLLLVATSPFAIRYAAEARMYSLMVLLTALGAAALAAVVRAPGPRPVAGLAVVTGALLYTHYWALDLVASTALLSLLGLRRNRPAALRVLAGLAVGCLTFLPWVPSLLTQMRHTGTPWAGEHGLAVLTSSFVAWSGGRQPVDVALGALLVVLAAVALLWPRRDAVAPSPGAAARRVPVRPVLLMLSLGTLLVAGVVSLLTDSATAGRYSSVAVLPFLALVACGLGVLPGVARTGLLAVVSVLGLVVGVPEVTAPRTQAAEVARGLEAAAPGDLVVFCPDQLGPSVSRLVRPGLRLVVYPDLRPADRIDWTDYARRNTATAPGDVAAAVLQRAGGSAIWVVTGYGYRVPSDARCRAFVESLAAVRGPGQLVVARQHHGVVESQRLQRFAPVPGAVAAPG